MLFLFVLHLVVRASCLSGLGKIAMSAGYLFVSIQGHGKVVVFQNTSDSLWENIAELKHGHTDTFGTIVAADSPNAVILSTWNNNSTIHVYAFPQSSHKWKSSFFHVIDTTVLDISLAGQHLLVLTTNSILFFRQIDDEWRFLSKSPFPPYPCSSGASSSANLSVSRAGIAIATTGLASSSSCPVSFLYEFDQFHQNWVAVPTFQLLRPHVASRVGVAVDRASGSLVVSLQSHSGNGNVTLFDLHQGNTSLLNGSLTSAVLEQNVGTSVLMENSFVVVSSTPRCKSKQRHGLVTWFKSNGTPHRANYCCGFDCWQEFGFVATCEICNTNLT
eukprot:c9166_g1_i2.p1 GENE.c9166_g1_i2~~c9166_g1_i2.p1  ORF type:complete len:331 (+),score=34.70 c9166_g1_i2:58-1050(+)